MWECVSNEGRGFCVVRSRVFRELWVADSAGWLGHLLAWECGGFGGCAVGCRMIVSWVWEVVFLGMGFVGGWVLLLGGGWLGGGDVGIDGDVPLVQQPFGDVVAIPVPPAPALQVGGEDIRFWRESQLSSLQFEFGGDGGAERQGMPPVRIAAPSHFGADDGWSCHSPR